MKYLTNQGTICVQKYLDTQTLHQYVIVEHVAPKQEISRRDLVFWQTVIDFATFGHFKGPVCKI